jgi:hypothetical protein
MKIKIISIGVICIFLISAITPAVSVSSIKKNEIKPSKIINKINNLKSIYNDVVSKLEPGDILVYLPSNNEQNGHCQLYTGIKQNGKHNVVEAIGLVVSYSFRTIGYCFLLLKVTEFFDYAGIDILRVNATEKQKQNAIDFAKLQVGKRYQFDYHNSPKNYNPEDKSDQFANMWYCSELPWAAYYNCNNSFPKKEPTNGYTYGEGIDIDQNGWKQDSHSDSEEKYPFPHPRDFFVDDDINRIKGWERIKNQ